VFVLTLHVVVLACRCRQGNRMKCRKKSWFRGAVLALAVPLFILGPASRVAAQPTTPVSQFHDPFEPICPTIEAAARANGLPVDFFTRVIWQESRFRPDVIGPPTRHGARAQGIAQFMPATAAERGLYEPFNPVEALPKSGEFLAELRDEFGNLGLAAAAYNAGPQRVRDFLSGARGLPSETLNYVLAITGRPVEDWVRPANKESKTGTTDEALRSVSAANCRDLISLLAHAPGRHVSEWNGRKVPSWCRGLRHPNVSECGSVRLMAPVSTAANPTVRRSHVHLVRTSLR